MPCTIDFAAGTARPAPRSAGYDEARPWLFEGLEPKYATRVIRGLQVPMRDGMQLSTDLHIPLGATLPLPVVLVRTPYDKRSWRNAWPQIFCEQGFVFVAQDIRGRYESQGEWIACGPADREDGWDTIDWLANQPWCSGRVGMMGTSYTGETTGRAAAMRHPALQACIMMFDGAYSGGENKNGAYLQSGLTMLRMMFGWYRDYVPKVSLGPPPHVDREWWYGSPWAGSYASQPVALPPVDPAHLLTLPVDTLLDRAGAPPNEFGEQMRRSADPGDPYWDAQGFLSDQDRFDVPVLHITGPLERGGSGFDNFRLFRTNSESARSRDNQKLLFTPAPHSMPHMSTEDTSYGVRNFGDTRFPYYRSFVEWFGHWLRDDANDVEVWPDVRYYTGNSNRWRTTSDWPPAEAGIRQLYLGADGALVFDAPDDRVSSKSYTYDPADPTPSEPPDVDLDILGGGYVDRTAIEARADVLCYTTPPLAEELTIAGPVSVDLHVSSSAKDTDFIVTLVEVNKDDRPINITHGIARMRWREGHEAPVWMTPGEVCRVTIDLWHAAMTIPKGHRIRLEIASSSFPAWDRNLNTGGNNYTDIEWAKAENTVYGGATYPSALTLHVI